MADTYPKKDLYISCKDKVNFFLLKKIFYNIFISLFFILLSSVALAQSTTFISCNQINNISQFNSSLILYANESSNFNTIQIKKYLNQQIEEQNISKEVTDLKQIIHASLTSTEKYKDLSEVYITNINKHNYYEYFTSQVFCNHIENLKSVDTSVVFSAANSLLERKLIEKLIHPYKNISSNSKVDENKKIIKPKKYIISNPAIPMMALLSANPPREKIVHKWEYGVATSSYNTSTYNTVRASEDWTDLNNNFEGYSSGYDFRDYWGPVHPYETIGVDDAYAYGFTGKGKMIAIHDSEFCGIAHEEILRAFNEGRIVGYPRDYSNFNWCDTSNTHGITVAVYAMGDFQNDSTLYEDTIMGVAYNADVHLADYWGWDGSTNINCNPSKWALNLDDAKLNGAVVQNNSWGFDDDLNPDLVKKYMDDNNKTLAEALVHYQGIKTAGLAGSTSGKTNEYYDIGLSTVEQNWTVDDWNTFFDSINSFQETGVLVNAGSNDNYGNMGVVNCTASEKDGNGYINQAKQCHDNPTKTIDTSGGLPYLLPSLRDAWIQVVNVLNYGFTNDNNGGQQMWSAPCAQMAAWCVSGDGVKIPGAAYTTDEENRGVYWLQGSGTSYAAPMISGAVAIMAEAFPTLSPADWTHRIFATANNTWFNNTNCFDWSKVTDSSLVTSSDVGGQQNGDYWTASCGGIDGYISYGEGVKHGYNEIYGHGYPDLKKALEPINYKKIKVRDTQYALAASTILLSGLTYQNLNFNGVQGQFHDALYTGFNFNMDDLIKHPVRNYSRRLNSFNQSSRKQWIDSIGSKNTDLSYGINYSKEEDEFYPKTNTSSPDISYLSYSISNDINSVTNFNYKISSDTLLRFDIGERPLQNFLVNGGQQDYLPFTSSMDNGYSIGREHLLNNQNKLSYTIYQGDHYYTEMPESGILMNFSNFDIENDSYLNAYAGYNEEDTTFLRNQTSGAFGTTNALTYHTGFSYENNIINDTYFGSNLNLGYTTTTVSKDNLISSIDPLITSQYVIGLVEKYIFNKKDSLSFNLSQPLSVESGKATIKIPYYYNKNSNGFNEQKIDMSIKDRFNKLNLDYVYNFSDQSQLHTGITVGMTNFNELDSSSFIVNYKLFF